jgi:RimJ/RimL family protein N-acetyltransferase
MGWTITPSLPHFTAAAGGFLERRPAEHTVLRTVCGTLARRGTDAYGPRPPLFGWWREGEQGPVEAAFLQTPPHPPLLARGPEQAARELAAAWDGPLEGARGEAETVRAFGAAWQERTGAVPRVVREERLHRLAALTPRDPAPPGRARIAGPADLDLLLRWHTEFARDIGAPADDMARGVPDALRRGGRTLWEVDGEPAAMAGSTSPEDGAIRVVAVYTPPALRGRGYAGAVTAAVSQAALDAGAEDVLLFTDLANPVSNHVYRRLGYVPVRDQLVVAFG